MSQPLISIVIPAYNTEVLISSALESALTQNYENIEIIVVNDASTDKTAAVVRAALANGARPYKIIGHDQNRGVSVARNTGMAAATGEYITFFDSDDRADPDHVSSLYKAISDGGADMAVCGYKKEYLPSGRIENHSLEIPRVTDVSAEFAERIVRGSIGIYYGASLYRMNFLAMNGIRFTDGCKFGEDAEFFIKAVSVSKKTALSSACHYVYRIHEQMGSRVDHISPEGNIKRYTDLAQARIRAGEYVVQHSKLKLLIDAAKYDLLPRYYLKMFTMHAWRNDKEAFLADLQSPQVREIILSSRRAFLKSPDIFLKTVWLMAFPNMYFRYRRRNVYRYKI